MYKCPLCGVPDNHYVVTATADESPGHSTQIATCCCVHCNYDWEAEHKPGEFIGSNATPGFELIACDAGL
jgi:hypothetical protein